MNKELDQLIENTFPQSIEIQEPQQEQEQKVVQDFTLLKRKSKEKLSLLQSIFQQKVNIEVQKKSNSFLQSYLKDWNKLKFKLLYQASVDGVYVEKFHQLCDGQGPTLIFYLSELGDVFGVYSQVSIKSSYKGIIEYDPELFVFQLDKRTVHYSTKVKDNLFYHNSYFNSLGNFLEFDIKNDIEYYNQIITCTTKNFGESFELAKNSEFGSVNAQIYLGGAQQFKILEVEVYSIL
ncbi:TLDc domain-containing protein [Oxytricha trifallax]|uniref:TLDc domain-containing protein n=1 Tax=Oxytricha trifallax TaxID=1172189 RepID=A0A073HZZ5_9SPIT|nr:TLDc domain-containing protein [Oxytricha trifallax]